jgi:quercetin dioxygenase-like cupin family protein
MLVDQPLRPVRAAEMEWEPLGTHGLRRKRLGFDPATQHTTSLVDIPKGWHGGGIAHFHEAFEEVLILSGSVTLDGRHYWTAGDYFYRPAFIVHGHDEKSPEGALTVIRSDGVLELLLVHEPEQDVEYPLPHSADPRGHVFQVPIADVPAVSDPLFPADWRIRPLSADPQSGARTLIADIPAGWRGTAPALGAAWEAMVLDGAVQGAAYAYAAGDYTAGGPEAAPLGAVASEGGVSVMLWLFGRE